jgi:hypothetical protein
MGDFDGMLLTLAAAKAMRPPFSVHALRSHAESWRRNRVCELSPIS